MSPPRSSSGLCSSRKDAKRTAAAGGLSINDVRLDAAAALRPVLAMAIGGRMLVVRKGRRQLCLVRLLDDDDDEGP